MQLNKIKKQTFASFDSSGAANDNQFMNDFKNHLTETLKIERVDIIGMTASVQDKKNVATIYFSYLTPEIKKEKVKKKKEKEKV
jgi:flagellar hook assembly protein FlgD